MKKIAAVIVVCTLIISACIVYLVRFGIGLRPAPLIQPSVMTDDQSNVASAVMLRLFKELQDNDYIVLGVLPETEESKKIINQAAKEYEKIFHKTVHFINDAENAGIESLLSCKKPCWLLISEKKANHLDANSLIDKQPYSFIKTFFTLTFVSFHKNIEVPKECDDQKRLSLDCLIPVSIRGVRRKMRDSQKRYFFLQKYDEKDYFLFIEKKI